MRIRRFTSADGIVASQIQLGHNLVRTAFRNDNTHILAAEAVLFDRFPSDVAVEALVATPVHDVSMISAMRTTKCTSLLLCFLLGSVLWTLRVARRISTAFVRLLKSWLKDLRQSIRTSGPLWETT